MEGVRRIGDGDSIEGRKKMKFDDIEWNSELFSGTMWIFSLPTVHLIKLYILFPLNCVYTFLHVDG